MNQYVLNDAGQAAINDFVSKFGKTGLIASAYYSDAENAADAFDAGYDAGIEINHFMSSDKQNHVLTLQKSWFDITPIDE